MKIIMLKSNLKEGLEKVGGVVSQKDNLPVLRNILLKASDGKLLLSSTNLEIGITASVAGKVLDQGEIAIPFQTFANIIFNLETEKINIETTEQSLVIKTENYKAKIQGTKAEDFPIIPATETKTHIEISNTALIDATQSIISAAHISEIRPELSGILFDFQITILKLVATDSFRLAEKTLYEKEFTTSIPRGLKAIIPIEAIREVMRIMNTKNQIRIFFDPHQVVFKSGDIVLVSRLIDGTYPDYEQIIPKTIETELEIGKSELLQGTKLVAGFSGKTSDIKLRLKEGKKVLEIYSSNPALGENSYLIPVKCRKGEPFQDISFNWKYVTDGLKALRGEKITFGINGETKPALLRSEDDASYFYIVMPIRL